MRKSFGALLRKDVRLLVSGKFFLMAIGFLLLYTAYVNWVHVRLVQAPICQVYLYDPLGIQEVKVSGIRTVSTKEALETALSADPGGVGLDASGGRVQVILYGETEETDRHRTDYALSLLRPFDGAAPEVIGAYTPEQKARREITCQLLFFELVGAGFLEIAALLFKEKGMGVLRVHAVLPLWKDLFLLSKLAVFLLCDLCFAGLLTLLNVGVGGAAVLPAVLLQTGLLSLVMALGGLLCALLLKDFRQFTLAYLVIAIFAATPVFLSANTSVKFDWIGWHPFYHIYMGLKNAYFGTDSSPAYYAGAAACVPPGNGKGGVRHGRLEIPAEKRPAGQVLPDDVPAAHPGSRGAELHGFH